MLQAELVPRIHPFCRKRQLNSSSSDLHSGNMISAPVSCLLAEVGSAMAGFRPDSFRCFGTVLCAQLRSSGFPFLLRRRPSDRAAVTVHRMAYYKHKTKILCFFIDYYTRYRPVLQEPLQFFLCPPVPRYAKVPPEGREGPLHPLPISWYRFRSSPAPGWRGGRLRRKQRGRGR